MNNKLECEGCHEVVGKLYPGLFLNAGKQEQMICKECRDKEEEFIIAEMSTN